MVVMKTIEEYTCGSLSENGTHRVMENGIIGGVSLLE